MKKTPDWLKVSAPAALLPLEGGRALRLLTETEEMQVRREAMELAVNEMDLPLCANACLVARALVCAGERVYADGRAVLDGLSAEEIEALAERWAAFRREKGVGLGLGEKRLDALKASLAAQPRQRLKWRVLKTFGALPTEQRVREMTEEDYLGARCSCCWTRKRRKRPCVPAAGRSWSRPGARCAGRRLGLSSERKTPGLTGRGMHG